MHKPTAIVGLFPEVRRLRREGLCYFHLPYRLKRVEFSVHSLTTRGILFPSPLPILAVKITVLKSVFIRSARPRNPEYEFSV